MKPMIEDDAIVLRTYNVGESDRYCILLTQHHGRMAARARGVRRLQSRRLRGLLPLHRVRVTLEQHTAGPLLVAADAIDPQCSWRDPAAFVQAVQGVEIVLRFTDDDAPVPTLYSATVDFLSACSTRSPLLLPAFSLQVLAVSGLLPSVGHSSASGRSIPSDALAFSAALGAFVHADDAVPDAVALQQETAEALRTLATSSLAALPQCSQATLSELERIVQGLLGSQLGSPLVSPSVCRSIAATPTCQVSGRAS